MENKVTAFLHIPKTSGTTAVKLIHKNLNEDQYLELSAAKLDLNETDGYRKYLTRSGELIAGLSAKERSRIRVIYGHCIPYGIHDFFSQEVRYVSLFRDPVERTVSVYNYLRTLAKDDPDELRDRLQAIFYVNGKIPSFESWYKKKFHNTNDFALLPADKFLEKFGYNTNLEQFYFVGAMERADDRLFLYSLLGVKRLFANENYSKKYFKANLLGKGYKNGLAGAYRVYNAAVTRAEKFEAKNKLYKRDVLKMKKEGKRIYLNQILYDFLPTIKHLKHRFSLRI